MNDSRDDAWAAQSTRVSNPEGATRAVFDTALSQVLSIVCSQNREADEFRGQLTMKDSEVESLKQIIGRLEVQVNQLTAEAEASHSEAAETSLALQKLHKESTEQIATVSAAMEDQRSNHACAIRDMEVVFAEKLAAERSQNEHDFQELRKGFEEDLENHRAQMEQAAAQQVAEVEEVWSKKYADAKAKLEKAVAEMRAMRQRSAEMRKLELEALDTSGKTLAQQMEEAMRLIRQAQDHSLSERLRYSSALLDDSDVPSILVDKENQSIPSPSQIKAQYTGRVSLPRCHG